MVGRLARIEALLERQGHQLQQHLSSHSSPAFPSAYGSDHISPPAATRMPRYQEPFLQADGGTREIHQFLIPSGHTAVASTLLALPGVRDQVGHYPRDSFYAIEETLSFPVAWITSLGTGSTGPFLTRKARTHLLTPTSAMCTPTSSCLASSNSARGSTELAIPGFAGDIQVAVSLRVYALGSIAVQTPDGRGGDKDGALASSFFEPALRIALSNCTWSFTPNLAVCQALLLCSSYFGYLGRPLHCWRLACFASQGLLHRLGA